MFLDFSTIFLLFLVVFCAFLVLSKRDQSPTRGKKERGIRNDSFVFLLAFWLQIQARVKPVESRVLKSLLEPSAESGREKARNKRAKEHMP